jgi:hypothetical protein
MHAGRRPETTDAESAARQRRRPRVVIFHGTGQAHVEVVELPDETSVGSVIRHDDRSWRVTGIRTGDRVLIAELDPN